MLVSLSLELGRPQATIQAISLGVLSPKLSRNGPPCDALFLR